MAWAQVNEPNWMVDFPRSIKSELKINEKIYAQIRDRPTSTDGIRRMFKYHSACNVRSSIRYNLICCLCTTLTTVIYSVNAFRNMDSNLLVKRENLSVPQRFDLVLRRLHLNTLFIIKFVILLDPNSWNVHSLMELNLFDRNHSQKEKKRSLFNLKIKFYISMMCRLSYVCSSCCYCQCRMQWDRWVTEKLPMALQSRWSRKWNTNGMRFIDKINLISISITHSTKHRHSPPVIWNRHRTRPPISHFLIFTYFCCRLSSSIFDGRATEPHYHRLHCSINSINNKLNFPTKWMYCCDPMSHALANAKEKMQNHSL